MKCPVCDLDLLMTERQGIEIDYCPKCRGIWLDRGELDILIERSKTPGYGSPPEKGPYQRQEERYPDEAHRVERYHHEGHRGERYHNEHYDHRGRKRKSFLEDIFDFGD